MFYQKNVLGDCMKEIKENEELSVSRILQEVCEDICDNYCKYRDTADEDCNCEITRNGSCPLFRLMY